MLKAVADKMQSTTRYGSACVLPFCLSHSRDLLNNLPVTATYHYRHTHTHTHTPLRGLSHRRENQLIEFPLHRILVAVSVSLISLSVCLRVKGDISQHGGRAATHLHLWEVCLKHLSIIRQLQLKAPANIPPHLEQAISLICFSKYPRSLSVCVCVSVCLCVCVCMQHRPISRMWSAEMAVVGRQCKGKQLVWPQLGHRFSL